MSESLRITELRREIAEMEATRDHLDPALYEALHASLISDLEELGATLEPAPEPARRRAPAITIPPQPRRGLASQAAPAAPEAKPQVLQPSPSKAALQVAPIPESPMPKPELAAPAASPEEQLDTLLAHLSNATAAATGAMSEKAYMQARSHIYLRRCEISKLVKKHGLDAPDLPRIPANPWPSWRKGKILHRPSAPQQDAPPQHLGVDGPKEVAVPRKSEPSPRIEDPTQDQQAFVYVQRLVLKRISILNDVQPSKAEWRQIAQDLAILETTAGAARQIAERHAGVA